MRSRRRRGRTAVVASAVAAALWAAALVAAPLAVTHHDPASPAFLAATAAYAVGAVICHQQPPRSFHLREVQLPVCARCAGLYAGAPGGLLMALMLLPAPGRAGQRFAPARLRTLRRLLIVAAAPTMLTVVVDVPNAVRALSAVPLGLAVAWIAAWTVREAMDE